jgi:hypothetical protein
MVCVEASGIGQGILRKNGRRETIPKRSFGMLKFLLQEEPSFAVFKNKTPRICNIHTTDCHYENGSHAGSRRKRRTRYEGTRN